LQAVQKRFIQEIQLYCNHYSPNLTVIGIHVHLNETRVSPEKIRIFDG